MNSGAPSAEMRRYRTAPSATSPSPPMSSTIAGGCELEEREQDHGPIASASHSACEPSAAAASSRPAPCRRATCAVVP